MKKLVCALRDQEAEVFLAPVTVPTLAAMYRDLKDAIAGPKDNALAKYPQDFVLYQLGVYDDETGILDVFSPPERLLCCDVFVDVSHPGLVTDPESVN